MTFREAGAVEYDLDYRRYVSRWATLRSPRKAGAILPQAAPNPGYATRRNEMSATLINLIVQLIAGAVGGNAAGAAIKNLDLGAIGNTIVGAIGGAGGGTVLTALLPMLQGAAGGVDIGQLLGQAVGGGVAGAVVTAIVGVIKNAMAGQTAR
jgi:hypothetical protein